jgi:uncharacterized membrane protein
MNIRRYRDQLVRDLDRWIANGWVPAASRDLILADLPAEQQGRTALWLGMVGVTLAGVAVIAGIADNWSVIPRALKLALLLALIWGALGGAIWAGARGLRNTVNGLALLAALIFAASVGLLGQSLNIPGDPDNALLVAAIGAGLLSLAAESVAAGVVYLALVASMYWAASLFSSWDQFSPGDNQRFALFLAGGGLLALLLRSRLLAHGTLLLVGALVLNNADHVLPGNLNYAYAAATVWAVAGTVGLVGVLRGVGGSGILLGWSAWHGFAAFGLSAFDDKNALLHHVSWIAIAVVVIALVARLRQGWTLTAAVLSLIAACWLILTDLGLSLGAASAVFGAVALVVLAVAFFVRRAKES